VLVLASGGAVHNLGQFRVDRERPAPWAVAFEGWLAERIEAGDEAALVDYRRRCPEGKLAHPTDEHFLPLFVALGAAGSEVAAERIIEGYESGALALDSYLFRPAAVTAH
jgi:4,5-DOPA dioxygenase extradiol